MRAGRLELRHNIGDGNTDAWDLLEAPFGDDPIERLGQSGQAVGSTSVSLGTIGIATAQCGALGKFPQQLSYRMRVELRHANEPVLH